jgi:hypothetical protein
MRLLINAAIVCCLSAAMILAAADPSLGTWKMNVAKSKFSPGPAPKNVTSVYGQEGDWIVIKTTGFDPTGQPIDRSNRYKRDGQAYPYDGPNGRGTITVKRIDDFTSEAVTKLDGGGTVTTRSVISKDGKTRTMTTRGANAKGEKVNNVVVWDRQ